ncbi:MAG: oligoendopeptidase F family protein, partial [Candidatus Marinimicrobia bacterium]|nr:oligoendopeptidase F family protein [Candidatus Neomarinimicrobiota bacterium]
MLKKIITLNLLVVFCLFFTIGSLSATVKNRSEIDENRTWNLDKIYPSDEAWEKAKAEVSEEILKVSEFKGTLANSPEDLLACLKFNTELGKKFSRLYYYASLKSDQDTRNANYSAKKKQLSQMGTEYGALAAYIDPEILEMKLETLSGYIADNEELQDYQMVLMDLHRTKEHTLSEKEERIIAEAGRMAGSPSSIFSTFVNAELPYPDVTLSNGETVTLNQAGYNLHRTSKNREDRKLVFDTFWKSMSAFKMTLGEKLYANIKKDMFYSNVRNYDNTLESSLDRNNIDKEVYMSLVDNVNDNLGTFHRYLKLKARMPDIDTLYYYDVYAPTVAGVDLNFTLEEAQDLVLESLKPMGREYQKTVKKAFNDRWIDFYPNTGKRSGAYSAGGITDLHPFILMNYNGKYTDVSTLAHELGHTMHSYFSNKT